MRTRIPLPRVWIVMALLCFLVAAPLVLPRVTSLPRGGASASGSGIAVIGDSISARYDDDPGSDKQAWWSAVGRHYDTHVTTFAESGSGYLRSGNNCMGTRFGDRLVDVAKSSPKVVIVEGGRNDWAFCTGRTSSETTNAMVQAAVDRFLTKLQSALEPDTKIYVLGPPWGPLGSANSDRITSIIRASALRHHISFIGTQGVFDHGRTVDGIHPNREGSMALGRRVIDGIGPQLPR